MSADNWTLCPRCNRMAVEAKEKQINEARNAYGKLPIEEYEAVLLASREPITYNDTLREDYEFYMGEDGSFSVSYLAHCEKCGFEYEFNHSEQVKI